MSKPDRPPRQQTNEPNTSGDDKIEMPEINKTGPARTLPDFPLPHQRRPSGTAEYVAIMPDAFFDGGPEELFQKMLVKNKLGVHE